MPIYPLFHTSSSQRSYPLFYTSSSQMGRKRTAEDRRRHAEQNGYIDDETAAAVDDNPVPRDVLDYTKERYDVQMELWHK